jgi:hypothetical protein
MLCPDFEPREGSLPLLSPPLGMKKLLAAGARASGWLGWGLFTLAVAGSRLSLSIVGSIGGSVGGSFDGR